MKPIQQRIAALTPVLFANRHAFDCIFLLATFATTASGQPVIWSTRVGGNGHAYEFVYEDGIDWPDAKAAAESRVYGTRPGHLATLTSAAENSFVTDLLSSAAAEIAPQPLVEAWLGGYQIEGESRPDQGWMWVTPEQWQYTNWRSGEPNDVGDERYLGIFGPGNNGPIGEWNDQAGISNIQGYFVEYPVDDYPEPPVVPEPPPLEWFRQHGASYISSVSARTDGRIFISGSAAQSLTSDESDAHVALYSSAGNLLWSRQIGTNSFDTSNAVSGDGLGSVYIAGETEGSLGGPNFGGSSDAFLAKFDEHGEELWTRQIGTENNDVAFGVSADGRGSVYVGGRTGGSLAGTNAGSFDPFLSRYDGQGNVVWHRQLGTTEWDVGYAVSADGLGNVYLTGSTEGSLGGPYRGGFGDVFVSKYDETGNLLWSRQLGSNGQDIAWGISADALGNVFVVGNAEGALPGSTHQGSADAFIARYDADGNRAWIRQFGTENTDIAWSVSADGLGNVHVSGEYRQQNPGGFLRKYSAEGELLWEELARNAAVAADGLYNVYLGGTNFEIGSFVAKYSEIPEPHVSLLALLASTALLVRRSRHNQ